MPKRKLEEELEQDWVETDTAKVPAKTNVKKNSLDSDEESDGDEKQYEILAEDDIEGQEDGTAQFDGDVRITPFNMKEELEEGHFDADGHYHFNKDGQEVKDHWLDNIDWVKVKKSEPTDAKMEQGDSSDDDEPVFDHISAYKKILEFLKPGESVAKALRRLGGNTGMTASQRWKQKKKGGKVEDTDKTNMLALTELANGLLNGTGNMNVYQETYEQISRTINGAAAAKPVVKSDPLDMYADDFDEKEKARMTSDLGQPSSSKDVKEEEPSTSAGDLAGNDDVSWEYKWTENSEEIHGPHTSSQMLAWVKDGYFTEAVCVRKVGTSADFYSCRRVDFDLYI